MSKSIDWSKPSKIVSNPDPMSKHHNMGDVYWSPFTYDHEGNINDYTSELRIIIMPIFSAMVHVSTHPSLKGKHKGGLKNRLDMMKEQFSYMCDNLYKQTAAVLEEKDSERDNA